jgi:hypothetical protein
LSVDAGPVSYRKDFETVRDATEYGAELSDAQAVTSLPLALHGFDVARTGGSVTRDRFKNSQGGGSIDCAKLCLSFLCE